MSAAAVKADQLDAILAALADPHRRRVVDLLSRGPQPAGELARAVGLTPPAMSRHLRALKTSGLVEDSHPDFDARVRVYQLKSGSMAELRAWIEETERLWSDQLVAFKSHLER